MIEIMNRLSVMRMTTCGRRQLRYWMAPGRSQRAAGQHERRPHHDHQSYHQPTAQRPIERKRNDSTAEQHQGCAESDGPKAYPDTRRPLGIRDMWGHGDCFVAEKARIDATSGQLTQVTQTTKETAAGTMPFPAGSAIEVGSGSPGGAPGGQNATDITAFGDPFDRSHYQVRRDPDETVHQRGSIAGKKIGSTKGLARGHGTHLIFEQRSNI
ncbi:MAG TPA: hypothetical protein VFR21_13880, partial [Bradyrhizobium sp.]|jgi:hypothetical protein|nr:hypothetical protein [Bradyrhizobium sp.]